LRRTGKERRQHLLLRRLPRNSWAPMASNTIDRSRLGIAYAWSGFAIMWAFWVSFVIFLCEPRRLAGPLVPCRQSIRRRTGAAVGGCSRRSRIDTLFGLQHSLMARPWLKRHVMDRMSPAFERCTYVHVANLALFALILGWQRIPVAVRNMEKRNSSARHRFPRR
jgi:hypothetical protein